MNWQPRRSIRFQFPFRPAVAICFLLLGAVSCFAQSFDGGGDGSSWNDRFNWSFNNLPTAEVVNIRPSFDRGFSVQVNSPTTSSSRFVIVRASTSPEPPSFNASLNVNAVFSCRNVSAEGDRASIGVNANIFEYVNPNGPITTGIGASQGGTLNLNAGTINLDYLEINDGVFNQNGGHFNVGGLSLFDTSQTVTIGLNDNVTGDITFIGPDEGGVEPHLICNRPINLVSDDVLGNGNLSVSNARLTIGNDFNAERTFSMESGTLNWSDGIISTTSFGVQSATINRSGNGHLEVEESFSFDQSTVAGAEPFTIQRNDLLSGFVGIGGGGQFPTEVTIESPHTFGRFSLSFTSIANFQQESGETEGLTVDSFSNPSFGNSTLNLGFDSQSASGLDWVFRTKSPSASVLEDMIDDGRIVVSGAEFEVEHDAVTGFTYIQAVSPQALLGDCDLNGEVNFLDIAPFIASLSSGDFLAQADCDESGEVNFLDIAPFIAVLSGS